jgi:hypothetical protein
MEKDYPLLTVYVVACVGMMSVAILGQYWDLAFREVKIRTVPCSVTIENMARKLNVTLMDTCEVME